MPLDHWREVESLYHAARAQPPAKRTEFLARACENPTVRREVESLLANEANGDRLLEDTSPSRVCFQPGTRFGPYEIVSAVGSGGMGDVYKALDTRLGRNVAIKVVAERFSERFAREAHAIAALNHPHVCTLHDVGPNYLVMELLEGETLAARLRKGPLAPAVAARYGMEIADALAAAHARGIIHRDLKPGNIMLTRTGVKVLDFGIATLTRPGAEGKQAEHLTDDGRIPGTLAYMAPEQLAGEKCDARSDVYSCGLLLYEMLTGKRLLTAAVQPGTEHVAVASAPHLESVVRACLTKDPEERWQSALDLKINLEWASRSPGRVPGDRRLKFVLLWGTGAVLAITAASAWVLQPVRESLPAHFVVSPPEGTRIALRMPTKALASVAPDGKHVVLVAEDISGTRSLWLRALNSADYRHLDETEGASLAVWSPDSQYIGFFAEGKLKKVRAAGGPAQTICDVAPGDGEGATWNNEGVIVFAQPRTEPAALPKGGLLWVPAAGGAAQPATVLDQAGGDVSHSWPQFLPDGRHFLFLARNKDPDKSRIYVQEVGSQTRHAVLVSKTQAMYARGRDGQSYLLFPRDRALLAQPLNLSTFMVYGAPTVVAAGVSYNTLYGTSTFTVSENGVLAYRSGIFSGGTSPIRQLVWYTRRGDRMFAIGEQGLFGQFALSPDETMVAVDRNMQPDDNRFWDIWTIDLASGTVSRLTQGPDFRLPVWSPDSRTIAAISQMGDQQSLVEIPRTSGSPRPLMTGTDVRFLESWTPDGRSLLFSTQLQSFRLPLSGKQLPVPLLSSDLLKGRSRVSPDGRWIAYQSTESGKNEVYVRSFPALEEKRQVSSGGGAQPVWGKNGKELYYLTLNAKLMVVDVKSAATIETSKSRQLFQTPIEGNPLLGQYAVASDGQRFLMMENAREGGGSGTEQFHVVLNWFSELSSTGAAK